MIHTAKAQTGNCKKKINAVKKRRYKRTAKKTARDSPYILILTFFATPRTPFNLSGALSSIKKEPSKVPQIVL